MVFATMVGWAKLVWMATRLAVKSHSSTSAPLLEELEAHVVAEEAVVGQLHLALGDHRAEVVAAQAVAHHREAPVLDDEALAHARDGVGAHPAPGAAQDHPVLAPLDGVLPPATPPALPTSTAASSARMVLLASRPPWPSPAHAELHVLDDVAAHLAEAVEPHALARVLEG